MERCVEGQQKDIEVYDKAYFLPIACLNVVQCCTSVGLLLVLNEITSDQKNKMAAIEHRDQSNGHQ